jgi:hypothetical protein
MLAHHQWDMPKKRERVTEKIVPAPSLVGLVSKGLSFKGFLHRRACGSCWARYPTA